MKECIKNRFNLVIAWTVGIILLTSFFYNSQTISPKLQPVPSTHLRQQSKHEWKMLRWRDAFLSGNYSSNVEIAVKVFGKAPPAVHRIQEHSYPFLTMDTLRVWTHWSFVMRFRFIFTNTRWTVLRGPTLPKNRTMKDGDTIFLNTGHIEE